MLLLPMETKSITSTGVPMLELESSRFMSEDVELLRPTTTLKSVLGRSARYMA